MEEKRKFKRFCLELHTEIEIAFPGKEKKNLDLMTSDVSAGGAFFYTNETIPQGVRVIVRLRIASETLKNLTGAQGYMEVKGSVIRSEPRGMAICFDEDYHFRSLRSL